MQFEQYEGSAFFIDCVYYSFERSAQKEKQAQWFITNHFRQYDCCDIVMMKRCAAHWSNVAYDKLNQMDYLNYKHTMHTLVFYRMIIRTMKDLGHDRD